MIQNLYTIGKVLSENEDYKRYFTPWENPFSEGKVIVADLKNFKYQKGSLSIAEDKKVSNTQNYLYKKFSKGVNIVPTFIMTKTKSDYDGGKTFDKLVKCIENYHVKYFGFEKYKKTKRNAEIKKRFQAIKEDLEKFEFDKNERYLFSIKLNGKWLGELKYFQDFFETEYLKSNYTKNYEGIVISKNENYTCSITGQKTEVFGFVDTLGFTVNSNSFMRGGFNQDESYKMFPVSVEAVKLLIGSRKIVINKLSRHFYKLKYIIVPHFINRENQEALEEVLESFIENSKSESYEITGDSIILNEMILKAIAQESKLQGSVYYDILFYEQQQNQFLIKLHLSDVIPSQIKRLFEVKKEIEKRYSKIIRFEYENEKTKQKIIRNFYINFSLIKDFFSVEKKENNRIVYVLIPYFFTVLEAVFYGTNLNEQQIIKAFFKQIQIDFKQQKEKGKSNLYIRRTKSSFALYQYFLNLGLFKNKTPMEENQEQTVHLTAEEFIKQHPEFFDSQYKIGVFLLGNLSAYLMSKQYKKLKSNPFMKQLNSLNIDEKTIKGILPKLISKMREYDSAIPDMEQKIARSLVVEHNLTKVDISYTFTLGLIMQKEFAKAYIKKDDDDKTEQND